jgi:hypothetical protein
MSEYEPVVQHRTVEQLLFDNRVVIDEILGENHHLGSPLIDEANEARTAKSFEYVRFMTIVFDCQSDDDRRAVYEAINFASVIGGLAGRQLDSVDARYDYFLEMATQTREELYEKIVQATAGYMQSNNTMRALMDSYMPEYPNEITATIAHTVAALTFMQMEDKIYTENREVIDAFQEDLQNWVGVLPGNE